TVALTMAAFVFQVAVGAAVVMLHVPAALRGLHLALAAAVWAGTVILAVIVGRRPLIGEQSANGAEWQPRAAQRTTRDVVLDYIKIGRASCRERGESGEGWG